MEDKIIRCFASFDNCVDGETSNGCEEGLGGGEV